MTTDWEINHFSQVGCNYLVEGTFSSPLQYFGTNYTSPTACYYIVDRILYLDILGVIDWINRSTCCGGLQELCMWSRENNLKRTMIVNEVSLYIFWWNVPADEHLLHLWELSQCPLCGTSFCMLSRCTICSLVNIYCKYGFLSFLADWRLVTVSIFPFQVCLNFCICKLSISHTYNIEVSFWYLFVSHFLWIFYLLF